MDRGIDGFFRSCCTSLSSLLYELSLVTRDLRSKRVFLLLAVNAIAAILVTCWSMYSNSICLAVCSTLLWIDFLALITSLLGFWVEQKKPNKIFTFGHIRCEILFVFVITIAALLSSLLTLKECLVRLSYQPVVQTSRMTPGIVVTAAAHLVVTFANDKAKAFTHVFSFSSSNLIQDQIARFSRRLCQRVPGLSTLLLPRVNPFLIFLVLAILITVIADVLINIYESDFVDTFFGSTLSLLLILTVMPLSSFTGKTLLQTTPAHMIGHLDKCLREASTMEGVLEFRNEHFWTLGYNDLVGSIHVRVRRDANEQVVLSHLTNRLSNLVSDLTIQVFKDEWSWQPSPSRLLRQENATLLKYTLPSVSSPAISSSSSPNASLNASSSSTITLTMNPDEKGLRRGNEVADWVQDV